MKFLPILLLAGFFAACAPIGLPGPSVSPNLLAAENACTAASADGIFGEVVWNDPYIAKECPVIDHKYWAQQHEIYQQEHQKQLQKDRSVIEKALSE